jgi:hypothetical protein
LEAYFLYMIFKNIYFYESESNLLSKQFHKTILINHLKRFLEESRSKTFLRESGSLLNTLLIWSFYFTKMVYQTKDASRFWALRVNLVKCAKLLRASLQGWGVVLYLRVEMITFSIAPPLLLMAAYIYSSGSNEREGWR